MDDPRSRARAAARRPWRDVWRIAQAAVAAGVAWLLAQTLLGHDQPVFAAVAAVVALAAAAGARGSHAVIMLVGVGTGVLTGVLLVDALGSGAAEIAVAAFVAMVLVTLLTDDTLALIQAGAAATLIVAEQAPGSGVVRILDAVVGAGVALIISQLLLTPDPVRRVSRPARALLDTLADAVGRVARAIETSQPQAAAAERHRAAALADLHALREAERSAAFISRTTLRGRRRAAELSRLRRRLTGADALTTATWTLLDVTARHVGSYARDRELATALRALAQEIRSALDTPQDVNGLAAATEKTERLTAHVLLANRGKAGGGDDGQ
ncbi:FUSC family protein [Micromonospora sp. NPDC000018]|uniref:FUSC family protein n=1 Tax=Micromonospora sp. NPDC000018 TaxID=3154239 RepID=UPI00332C7927